MSQLSRPFSHPGSQASGKPVIYHVFTRLFGNRNRSNKPWGTLAENGVGKFSDFSDGALKAIKHYGVSHIWYTGVPHHALINDYSALGLSDDHPLVVKGRAGSPYAVKDYYNVNPDLADDPTRRLEEFQALIERTHAQGMKVVIDIVPNHVARRYESKTAPEGVRDFGADDDTSIAYARDNNFYYIPGQDFTAPDYPPGFAPLGGGNEARERLRASGPFVESPARWTGNGARDARPAWDDWFETVKVNYGVRPDGSKDFPELPAEYSELECEAHAEFWAGKSVPDSWVKFRDIALYWLEMGVDGFRYDMAEMVPVEFWSYMNSAIKQRNPEALLMAEVYQPQLYRDYIRLGKMDYLYDKVDLYDTLKDVVQHKVGCSQLDRDQGKLADIDHHLLRFLENHDEQRIAAPEFAGSAEKGWPAMVVTALLGQGPTMLYFGQAQGEKADFDSGFGRASRTTIFDYAGVPAHQDWMNDGRFDGGLLTAEQKALDSAYQRLLRFSANEPVLHGRFIPLHPFNLACADTQCAAEATGYSERCYSFVREHQGQWLLVLVNFDDQPLACQLQLPAELIGQLSGLRVGAVLREQINAETPDQAVQVSLASAADSSELVLETSCPAFGAQVFRLA